MHFYKLNITFAFVCLKESDILNWWFVYLPGNNSLYFAFIKLLTENNSSLSSYPFPPTPQTGIMGSRTFSAIKYKNEVCFWHIYHFSITEYQIYMIKRSIIWIVLRISKVCILWKYFIVISFKRLITSNSNTFICSLSSYSHQYVSLFHFSPFPLPRLLS